MKQAIVQTQNLTKRYGNFTALQDLNLTIEKGSIYGFIGPNGAGKTTTMRILATLLEPTGGQAWVSGFEVTARPYDVRRRIGYMPDFFGVYDNMKVWEYLDFFAASYKVPAAKRSGMIDDLLALVDLAVKKDNFVEELSRGMKQRLCLARTLVHEPDLLLLDEPASGLDPRARIELRELLKELRNLGKTILVSSHILSELTEMCTHVAIIERGRLLVSGGVEEILQAMQPAREIYIRVMARAAQAINLLQTYPGVLSAQPLPSGYRVGQSSQGWTQPSMPPPPPPIAPATPAPGVAAAIMQPPPGYAGAPYGELSGPRPLPPAPDGPATIHLRVNGDDALLGAMLRQLVQHDIPVFGFEEAIGNLEDIFLQTTKGLVQ